MSKESPTWAACRVHHVRPKGAGGTSHEPSESDQRMVSVFELHHRVNVTYPALDLLDDDEDMLMLCPKNYRNRFEPLPLILDTNVIQNARRDDNLKEDYSFTSWTKALPLHSKPFQSSMSPIPDIERLAQDMADLATRAGTTELKVATYVLDGADGPEGWVKLKRKTELRFSDGRVDRSRVLYHCPWADMKAFGDGPLGKQIWYIHMTNLMWRASDRAVRHVRFNLDYHGVVEQQPEWRPRRTMRLVPSCDLHIVHPEDLRLLVGNHNGMMACYICQEVFSYGDVVPVQLRCGHIYCEACLGHWCADNGVDQATCPLCRETIIAPEQIRNVVFGLDTSNTHRFRGTGIAYRWDTRFNDFENFERSCAEFDECWAENDDTVICGAAGKETYHTTWRYFVNAARSESESSTPRDLNPAYFPEFDVIDIAIKDVLFQLDQVPMPMNILFDVLIDEALRASFFAALKSPPESRVLLSSTEVCERRNNPETLDFRPGFRSFIYRTINRSLNSLKKQGLGRK